MPEPCTNDLNTLVTIEQNTLTKDSHGGRVDSWQPFRSPWAKVRHKRGGEGELTGMGGRSSQSRIEFTVRHFEGLTNANRACFRVVLRGDAHDISHVNHYNEQKKWLVITCEIT